MSQNCPALFEGTGEKQERHKLLYFINSFSLQFLNMFMVLFSKSCLISVANSCFEALGGNFRPFFSPDLFCMLSFTFSVFLKQIELFLFLFLMCDPTSFCVLEPFVYGHSSQLREIQKFFSKQLRLCINVLENIC